MRCTPGRATTDVGRAALGPWLGPQASGGEIEISERCLELQSITHVTRHTIKINQPIHITLHWLFGWEQPNEANELTRHRQSDMVTDMRHGILYEV